MITPKKLNAVMVGVRDFDISMAWYKKHFGFSRKYGTSNGVVVSIENGIEVILAPIKDIKNAKIVNADGDICIKSFGLELSKEDFANVKEEFAEDGNINCTEHPRYKSCVVEDPDGHRIELFINKRD